MTISTNTATPHATAAQPHAWLVLLVATACGLAAANLYYAQPLAGLIGASLALSPAATGLIVTLTQIGYGLGLLFIVPLGDLVENRLLVLVLLCADALSLLAAGLSTHPLPFLAAALCIGLGTVAVQVLVPYVTHLVPEARRGRAVGSVMSGLMLGIMLARPVASFVAQLSSWHVVFVLSSALMLVLALVLALALPPRTPSHGMRYGELLASMVRLARTTRVLQRRALYHAFLFASFSLFWTVTPLLLASSEYGLSQAEIALFALVGVAGAVAAPLVGRAADRGWSRGATIGAMLAVAGSFLLAHFSHGGSPLSLGLLVVAAVVLDFGVAANMTLGQRAIFGLGAELRSRLNGLYMATFFLGGAAGSALGAWAYAKGGWPLASWIGFALPAVALAWFATE
ncbi:MFS transporter [Variovorax sp. UC122_21]|uniref:MFS transporter n=1 Tax=Variovorax TaxID=34072 RepID=UPI001931D315|nr:MFS transporter [Variovorax paradoxus]